MDLCGKGKIAVKSGENHGSVVLPLEISESYILANYQKIVSFLGNSMNNGYS